MAENVLSWMRLARKFERYILKARNIRTFLSCFYMHRNHMFLACQKQSFRAYTDAIKYVRKLIAFGII